METSFPSPLPSPSSEHKPLNLKKYWILTSLATFIILPLWLNSSLLLLEIASEMASGRITLFLPALLLLFALPYAIYRFGKKATLPETFLSRYAPFIAPILFTLVVWLLIAFITGGDLSKGNLVLVIVFMPFFIPIFYFAFTGKLWLIPVLITIAYLFFMACFAIGTWRGKRFATLENKKALRALALILILASTATVQGFVHYHSVLRPDPDYPGLQEGLQQWDYYYLFSARPRGNPRLVSPKTPPSLQIDRDYPQLDGAEALIPIYAAAAKAIYLRGNEGDEDVRKAAVKFSNGSPAVYKALIDGNADMIFALAPSAEQVKEAAEQGLTFTVTPIAKEAFVFLVNEDNPVTNLRVEQIRAIYSGKINNWQEVGGQPGKIMAFQRNEGSGSQTAMLRNVMGDTPMRKPLKEEFHGDMGGLVRDVAAYRNMDHAIGYSFRYYATVMTEIPGIRLLAIDGIAPTLENIRNGIYPFTDEFCIVTARPLSENAQKLLDWFLSNEGQQLIEDVGYTPLKND
ncbi:MAG: substrate-binding domain-containing protein [Betaproteobacteria bacterium]|nr:substrate-binding domain-containing protein [Betaproteobacteria bacterium]